MVIPSICEKDGKLWEGGNGKRVIIGRVPELIDRIISQTGGNFQNISSLGAPYKWEDLLECEEVLVLPQNISTMTLFELATAGVPVCLPSKKWLKELAIEYPQLLEELTYAQLENIDPSEMEADNPNNWKSKNYLDWWLDRADFYDEELMPNIRQLAGFDDLQNYRAIQDKKAYLELILIRNERLKKLRANLIKNFAESTRNNN